MQIVSSISQMQRICQTKRQNGLIIGLVPTMGYLHEGHLSLMKQAALETDFKVATIFVNPSQFGPHEDLDRYPRDIEADIIKAEDAGIDILFTPKPEDIYPSGYSTYIVPENLQDKLCGASRPGHFRGVCTICLKLFNIIQPQLAYFGQKDAQQLLILRRMIADLNLTLEIKAMPIIREADGLAMSSRNVYLSPPEREQSLSLARGLNYARQAFLGGEREAASLIMMVQREIERCPLAKIDYIELVDTQTLQPLKTIESGALLAVAVYFGKTRLIDNTILHITKKG